MTAFGEENLIPLRPTCAANYKPNAFVSIRNSLLRAITCVLGLWAACFFCYFGCFTSFLLLTRTS